MGDASSTRVNTRDPGAFRAGAGAALAATGITQATAALLLYELTQVTTVASGAGVILPRANVAGRQSVRKTVWNFGANTLKVYPPDAGQIDALGLNVADTIAPGKSKTYWALEPGQYRTEANLFGAVQLGADAANFVQVTGAATGSDPAISAAGTDANRDLLATGKGTGRLNTTRFWAGNASDRAGAEAETLMAWKARPTYATTAAPGWRAGGAFSGTVTSGQAFFNQIAIDADTVDPTTGSGPGGAHGLYVGHTVSAGAKGGRTALTAYLNIAGAITAGSTGDARYQTAMGATAIASANAGGTAGLGNGRGNLFAANPIARLASGATFWNSLIGGEITYGIEAGASAYYKNGLQVVLGDWDAVAGTGGVDSGLLFAQSINGVSPGLDRGISFGHTLGWWAMKSTGTLIGTVPSTGGLGPAYAAANGVDFSAVTFSASAFKSVGFTVDGSGRITGTVWGNYANDAAAAAGGVPIGGIYRNGSPLMIRVS